MLWLSTTIANLALLGAIIRTRAWKRFPLFVFAQATVMAISLMLDWAYFSPMVTQESYANAWSAADQVYILLEAIAAWELFDGNMGLIAMACLTAIQSLATLVIYATNDSGSAYPSLRSFLDILNVFVILGLAFFVYAGDEENAMNCKSTPKKPKPQDLGGGNPPVKNPPPPPPTKDA